MVVLKQSAHIKTWNVEIMRKLFKLFLCLLIILISFSALSQERRKVKLYYKESTKDAMMRYRLGCIMKSPKMCRDCRKEKKIECALKHVDQNNSEYIKCLTKYKKKSCAVRFVDQNSSKVKRCVSEIKKICEAEQTIQNNIDFKTKGMPPVEKTKFVTKEQFNRFKNRISMWQIKKYIREGIQLKGFKFFLDVLTFLIYYKHKYDLELNQIYLWNVRNYKLERFNI